MTLVPLDVCEEPGWELTFEEEKRAPAAREWMRSLIAEARAVLQTCSSAPSSSLPSSVSSSSPPPPPPPPPSSSCAGVAAECVVEDRAGMGCVVFDPVAAHFLLRPSDFATTGPLRGVAVDPRGALIGYSSSSSTGDSMLTPIEAEVYVATRFPGRDVYMNALLGLLRTGEYAASTTSVVKE